MYRFLVLHDAAVPQQAAEGPQNHDEGDQINQPAPWRLSHTCVQHNAQVLENMHLRKCLRTFGLRLLRLLQKSTGIHV